MALAQRSGQVRKTGSPGRAPKDAESGSKTVIWVVAAVALVVVIGLLARSHSSAPEPSSSEETASAARQQLAAGGEKSGAERRFGLDGSTGSKALAGRDGTHPGASAPGQAPVAVAKRFAGRNGGIARNPEERWSETNPAGGAAPEGVEANGADVDPQALGGGKSTAPGARRPGDPTTVDAAGNPTGQQVVAKPREKDDPVLSFFDTGSGNAAQLPDSPTVANDVKLDPNGATFSTKSEFAVPVAGTLTGDTGSFSFWMKPDDSINSDTVASMLQLRAQHSFDNRIQLWQNGASMNLVFADDTGHESAVQFKSDSWDSGEWRNVSAAWGDHQLELYVNGQLAGTAPYDGSFKVLPDTLLHIGSNYGNEDKQSISGTISGFNLYDHPLTADEVTKLSSKAPH